MLAVALIFGGGGVGAPLFNLVVQLAAIIVLALSWNKLQRAIACMPAGLRWLLAISIALPLAQLLPLPPTVWTALPGRQLVLESWQLLGRGRDWAPLSVAPHRTLLAAIALVPPLAMIVAVAALPVERRIGVLYLIVLAGAITMLIGAAQLATANAAFNFYAGAFPYQLYGTFANHNAAGLLLVCALCALVALPLHRRREHESAVVAWSLGAVLVLGVVLTQSRSSALLLIVPFALLLPRLRTRLAALISLRRAALAGLGLAVVLGAALVTAQGRVSQALDHYRTADFDRHQIWEDALVSADRFWPAGSGIGTFDTVFQLDESLEYLIAPRAGRAHDEFIEVAIESGVPGLALLAAWAIWFVLALRSQAPSPEDKAIRRASAGVVLCIALQSLVDYPLRTEALLCIAACVIGLQCRAGAVVRRGGEFA